MEDGLTPRQRKLLRNKILSNSGLVAKRFIKKHGKKAYASLQRGIREAKLIQEGKLKGLTIEEIFE